MKTGDILLFKPINLLGDVIAFYTHGPFSHCGIALDQGRYIEALYPHILVSQYKRELNATIVNQATDRYSSLQTGVQFLLSTVGDSYSFFDIVDAAISPYAQFYATSPNSFDCSALCYSFLQKAGYVAINNSVIPDRVSPNDIARLLGVIS